MRENEGMTGIQLHCTANGAAPNRKDIFQQAAQGVYAYTLYPLSHLLYRDSKF
jgi:hypothetical protein